MAASSLRAAGLGVAALLLGVKLSAWSGFLRSIDVAVARLRGAKELKMDAEGKLTYSTEPVVVDVPGSLAEVWAAYFEQYKTGGGDFEVILRDAGNKYGEGLVRCVPIAAVSGMAEAVVDCVPYVRVRYAVVAGAFHVGASHYVGETLFEPLGNGQVRVTWWARFQPLFWGSQLLTSVFIPALQRRVCDNMRNALAHKRNQAS